MLPYTIKEFAQGSDKSYTKIIWERVVTEESTNELIMVIRRQFLLNVNNLQGSVVNLSSCWNDLRWGAKKMWST